MDVRELWLRVIRAAALSDHMGDMADGLNRISKVFDLDIPIDDDGDYAIEEVDVELEAAGFCACIFDAEKRLKGGE